MSNPFFKNTGPYDINYLAKALKLKSEKFASEKIIVFTILSNDPIFQFLHISRIANTTEYFLKMFWRFQ